MNYFKVFILNLFIIFTLSGCITLLATAGSAAMTAQEVDEDYDGSFKDYVEDKSTSFYDYVKRKFE